MANLDVQKKRKLSFPWILVILVLVIAAILVYTNREKIRNGGLTGSPALSDSLGDSIHRTIP